jgi:hypothetical protein
MYMLTTQLLLKLLQLRLLFQMGVVVVPAVRPVVVEVMPNYYEIRV